MPCPLGHRLVWTSFTDKPLKCDRDGCGAVIPRGESHPRCNECDFDECPMCAQFETPQQVRGGRKTCNSTSTAASDDPRSRPETDAQRADRLEAQVQRLRRQLNKQAHSGVRASGSRVTSGDGSMDDEQGGAFLILRLVHPRPPLPRARAPLEGSRRCPSKPWASLGHSRAGGACPNTCTRQLRISYKSICCWKPKTGFWKPDSGFQQQIPFEFRV